MGKLTKAPRVSTLRVMRTWEKFEESVGGRRKLVEALEHSVDERGQQLLQHLEDPRAAGRPLRELCGAARVSFPQLYHIYTDALRAKAHAESIIVQSEYLPRVMEDTCRDALTESRTCPDCAGAGTRRKRGALLTCTVCRGTGEVRGRSGNVENRKLVFESAGLTRKRAPLVAIQENRWNVPSLADTLKEAQKILKEGDAREIEAYDGFRVVCEASGWPKEEWKARQEAWREAWWEEYGAAFGEPEEVRTGRAMEAAKRVVEGELAKVQEAHQARVAATKKREEEEARQAGAWKDASGNWIYPLPPPPEEK